LENGFEIIEKFGWYDKTEIENGRELIMVKRVRISHNRW
jgi:hypothetical protein